MKEYTYYLMDWDGNLAQTLKLWLDACREAVEKRGVYVADEQIGASFGAFHEHMAAWGITDPEAAIEDASDIAKRDLPNVELYPDAFEVISELSQRGKKIALITTSRHEHVQHLLEKHDIAKYFTAVVASDDTVHHKPHPEPLEKALELLNGKKSDAVMIGDSDKDLGAARNFGIDSILFYPKEHSRYYDFKKLEQLEPTYIIEHFTDILNPFAMMK